MKLFITTCLFTILSHNVLGGDMVKGKSLYKENECSTCHSKNGMGEAKIVNGVVQLDLTAGPRIAGLDEKYIVSQVLETQSGKKVTKFSANMKKQIKDLTKVEIEDIAAYVAKGINPGAGAYKSQLNKTK